MSFFTVQVLQEKLSRLSLSQDSIETLSLWIIHHKAHASTSIDVWMEDMLNANADRRLMLFYLANDVLQNSRRRGANMFQDLFRDPLRRSVILVRGQKIQTSVERMFRIWKDRRVYDNAFLKELELLIEPTRKSESSQHVTPSFKLSLMEDSLTELRKFEAELKVKSAYLTNLRVDISNPTASLSQLKDKSEGGRVSAEFDEASQKLQDFSECLGIEVNERINILDMLKDCEEYQSHCLSEVQKTSSNYKQLGKKVKHLKSKLHSRLKELERAQSTATSDPTAKEDITDVGDMEIESDNESQDSLPSLTAPTTHPVQTPPPTAVPPPVPTGTTSYQQPPPQQLPPVTAQILQTTGTPYSAQPTRMPHPPVNAASSTIVSGPGPGGGRFPTVNVPPSSLPPSSNQPYPPPSHSSPTQAPRQPPPVSNFPPGNIPPNSSVHPGSNIPPRSNLPPGSNMSPRPNFPSGSAVPPGSNIPPRFSIPPRPNIPPGSTIPPRSTISPVSTIPPRPNVHPGSGIPHRPNIPPGSGIPPRPNIPPGSGIPPRSNIPPGSGIPPRPNIPPGSNIPPRSTIPVGSVCSNIPPRPNIPPGPNNVPPRPGISPGSNVPTRYQRPPFPPSATGMRPLNMPTAAPGPPPVRFSGPPLRPRFPTLSVSPLDVRRPPPPQRGPYDNTSSPAPELHNQPVPPAQTNISSSSAPPLQVTTPIRMNSQEPVAQPSVVVTNVPPPPSAVKSPVEADEDERRDSVDLLTRSQTGLDQRLKNMIAQRMFGGVLNECDGNSSPDGDEKPYSPASDQPEISISNTGTPKPEEDEDDDDRYSIPTPDSGAVTPEPEEGAINMNNPILQALYSSSPDISKKSEMSESSSLNVPPEQPIMSDPVADLDTEYLQGILNTVKSSSVSQKETTADGPTSLTSVEGPPQAATPQKQPSLAALKEIKITPTVTNLLGELFPQLSKTLQQNRKRKQESGEEEIVAQKIQRVDKDNELPPRVMPTRSHSNEPNPPQQTGSGPGPSIPDVVRPSTGDIRPPCTDVRPSRPDLGPPPHPPPLTGPPGAMPPRGMPPPGRGQYRPESPRGPFPPRYRGPLPFRGAPPPRGPPSMMRHPGPPPPQRIISGPTARYPPPGSPVVPNHTGPVPPGAYPTHPPGQYKQMGQRRTSGEGNLMDSYRPPPMPRPPYQSPGLYRPPRYV